MQRYQLTFPEKNAVWWSPQPDNCTVERKKECAQRMLYTPTPKSQCKSTFMPWDRPDPYQCAKMCQGMDTLTVNGCQAQKMQHTRRINTNGCLREPSQMQYTNKPINQPIRSKSILTDPNRNPPFPPQYGFKNSNAYDPIMYVYGDPYTY